MSAPPQMPEVIGSYRIKGLLGRGAMGAVYHAVHETLERPVALKILPQALAEDPELVLRFLREARMVATLKHDHIVRVFDAGSENGQHYIAMELIEGGSLRNYLEEKGPLDETQGLRLLKQAALGLAAAHDKGLVHRDIKPDNLLIDKAMNLHIVDFGLVVQTDGGSQLTVTGACLGTPQYMSPEQADGKKADHRTDLYSLGVTFFRALTGQPPFSSTTVMNLLYKHKFETPPDPRSLKPALSANACHLILRLLAKRREDRPQSAQEIANLIDGIARGQRVDPPSPTAFPSPMVLAAESTATLVQPIGPLDPTRLSPARAGARGAPLAHRTPLSSNASRKMRATALSCSAAMVALGFLLWPANGMPGQAAPLSIDMPAAANEVSVQKPSEQPSTTESTSKVQEAVPVAAAEPVVDEMSDFFNREDVQRAQYPADPAPEPVTEIPASTREEPYVPPSTTPTTTSTTPTTPPSTPPSTPPTTRPPANQPPAQPPRRVPPPDRTEGRGKDKGDDHGDKDMKKEKGNGNGKGNGKK